MNKGWYDGKELAIAFAVLLGLLANWGSDSQILVILAMVAGYVSGYLLQKFG